MQLIMKLYLTILLLLISIPASAAHWGVSADFADRDYSQSEYEAPWLAQRGIDSVFLSMRGTNYNWPNWTKVEDIWSKAGVARFWDLPVNITECERILGFEEGTLQTDDRAVLQNGSRAHFGAGGLGNFFNPECSFQLRRIAKAMARRLKEPAGYQLTSQVDLHSGSYDPDALASWQQFLKKFFGDENPSDDTGRDQATFNSAFSTHYVTWDNVPLFTSKDLGNGRQRQMFDLWLASSYADMLDSVCAEVKSVQPDAAIGPNVATLKFNAVDASVAASKKNVNTLYTDNPEAATALDCVAAPFGKSVFASGIKLIPGDYKASLQRALKLLPYSSSICFNYSGLIAARTGEKPAKIEKTDPDFGVITALAPFAGKFSVKRNDVLWIVQDETDGVFDSSCISEAALALNPDCIDFNRYKAIIYRTSNSSMATVILQKLFDYALKGGTVYLDAYNVAKNPTIMGRNNRHFWWQRLKVGREESGAGETTITFSGSKWTLPVTNPYLLPAEDVIKTSGKVTDSTGADYPLLMTRSIGDSGRWVFINVPEVWKTQFALLKAVVQQVSNINLPDPSLPRVYSGDNCALAIGGTSMGESGEAAIACSYEKAAIYNVTTQSAAVLQSKGGKLVLPEKIAPGEAKLWVMKPYGKPIVLYTDGTLDNKASLDDGSYDGKSLTFKLTEQAYVSSPERPSSLIIDGKQAQFEYDPQAHLVTIQRSGKLAEGRLEYTKTMAKTFVMSGSDEDVILLLNLQGVVNKDAGRLMLDTECRNDWKPSDRLWMKVWNERKGIGFEKVETFDELVTAFKDQIKGVVVYDPKLDATRYVALTIAGINSYLAVSPSQINGEIAKLPVKEDLRGRFKDNVEAYEWAIKNLRPQCSDDIAYSAGQTHDDVNLGSDTGIILGLDYAISHKGFIFNLSPCPEPAKYDNDKELVKGHPEDARLMDKIFDTYKAPAKIYGWNEPEWPFTSRISKHGHMLMCGKGANLSFHQHVPCDKKSFKQIADTHPDPKPMEDKYYIAFMTNEGDTPRVFTTFFFGAWTEEERGSIPINWGISPTLISDFPALAEYYYSTATKNDYFYAGVSGTGYSFLDQLPDVAVWAKYGAPRFKAADIDIADVWDEFKMHDDRYETYAKEVGIRLFTVLPRGESKPYLLPSGVPYIVPHALVHYKGTGLEDRIKNLNTIASENKPPYLIPLYGGIHSGACKRYKAILEALDPSKFEAISIAQMADMAKRMAEKK